MEEREGRREKEVPGGAGLSRIDALIRELEAARSTARKVRTWIIVLILAVVFVFVGLSARLYMQMKTNSEEYVAAIQLKMASTVETLGADVLVVVKNVLPDYREAFEAQMETTGPEIVAMIEPQTELFLENVAANMEETLSERMESMAKAQEALIKQTFPELRDEQKILMITKNLEKSLMGALGEVTVDRL